MGWLQAACHSLCPGHCALQQLLVMLKEAHCLQHGSDGRVWCYSGFYTVIKHVLIQPWLWVVPRHVEHLIYLGEKSNTSGINRWCSREFILHRGSKTTPCILCAS